MSHPEAIKSFVQNTLGCQCPEEVFEHLSVERPPFQDLGSLVRLVISVGGRLLVFVADERDASKDAILIPELVRRGVEMRDSRGYNRFRLVMSKEDSQRSEEEFVRQFESVPNRDDRTHFHVVKRADIPW